MLSIEGQCDPRFEKVRAAFAANFESRGEVGAATAVMLNGRAVRAGAITRALYECL